MTYIASEAHIVARLLENVKNQARRGRLAIGTCDADHLGMRVASCELYLTDDGDSCIFYLANHRCGIRNAGTLDNLVGIQYLCFGVVPLFPGDSALIKHLLIVWLNLSHIRDEHIKTFFLGQHSCAHTALCGTEDDNSFHIFLI